MIEDYSHSDVGERLYKLTQSAAIGSVGYIILKPVRILKLRLPRIPCDKGRLSRVELPAICFWSLKLLIQSHRL